MRYVVLSAVLAGLPSMGAIQLMEKGASDYTIVVPAKATAPEMSAARELQEHLLAVTGARLPIAAEGTVGETNRQILVGACERTGAVLAGVSLGDLGDDGIVMKTAGETLVLTGQAPRGVLYAVYTFLEDVVGCRWWTSTESFMPRKPDLRIPDLDVHYAPPLLSREAFYKDAFVSPFAVRLKLNGHFMRIPPEFGGHLKLIGWCHTFYSILPPKTHFASHPEWYSEIDGKRRAERHQLCLTNEAMRNAFTAGVLARLRQDPAPRIISVSQNDWGGRCQCAACRAVEEREGSPAGPLIEFVNAVAEAVEKEFPDVFVETLAYHYTRKAPLHVRPRRNVVIRLCSIECSFSQPLETGEQNASFQRDMSAWSAISPHLYVWNYVTNFSNFLLPHPNMRSLASDIRYFVKNKTLGLFEQGDAYSTTGDFIRLRLWVLSHLMWDPSKDQDALVREFLEGYYGAAAPHLLAYLDLIHNAVAESGVYLRCYMRDTAPYLSLEILNEASRLFDRAEAAVAGNDALLTRVRRERLPLKLVWLHRYHSLRRRAKGGGVEFLGPDEPVQACKDWVEATRSHENAFYGEGRPFDRFAENLSRRFRPPAPPPEFCRGLPKDAYVDLQDNLFRLYKLGSWVKAVDDPAASDGEAVFMPADHHQWAVQCELSDEFADGGPWRCYILARCEAKAAEGDAMEMGLYDTKAKKGLSHMTIPIRDAAGADYRRFDLGTHNLRDGMYFWVAPRKNPDQVTGIYVDRMVIVKQD